MQASGWWCLGWEEVGGMRGLEVGKEEGGVAVVRMLWKALYESVGR